VPTLSEAESKQVLARHGVVVAREALVSTPAEAGEAAAAIGFPVVVKLCGTTIAHKTERGLVRLGVADGAAATAAAAELLARALPEDGPVQVLVAETVRGSRELIAGAALHPDLGPAVMVGLGGILAEATADVTFRLAPLSPLDAAEMIDDLSCQRLLGGFRGEPPVDREQLAGVLLALSELITGDAGVCSVDVNPLIVRAGAPVAVDALVELRQ
jgi:acetyl-CoA synthetase (ADP-forming)